MNTYLGFVKTSLCVNNYRLGTTHCLEISDIMSINGPLIVRHNY
jgi:hypothetical protein